jgi:hypothetical protein
MARIDVDLHGPIFDARGPAAVQAMEDDVVRDVTQQAFANWMTNLNASIRNPTPYYETQVRQETRGDTGRVHDGGMIYGPWLEGTGERNRSTRFKGYASARRATQTTQAAAEGIAERAVRKSIRRLS